MRRELPCVLAMVMAVAPLGAAPRPRANGSGAEQTPSRKAYQVGKASWYGKQFHGRTTASGEAYDMFQFTAAHKALPLGTWIKVTNLKNDKWVIVRVNDRGPYVGNRVLDLSYAAAQMLGLRAHGVAKVRIDVVENPEGDLDTTADTD